MNIRFHKKFKKRYIKLPSQIQEKVDCAIFKFKNNPFESSLKNHKLSGHLKGKRSFSVTGDIRIIFEEWENYTEIIMLDLGSHNQESSPIPNDT